MARVIIVTGAFGALGRAAVTELAAQGHRVAAVDLASVPKDHGAELAKGGAAGANNAANDMAPYAASEALTEGLADKVRGRHVRVNMVQPTSIDTAVTAGTCPTRISTRG